MDGDNKPKRVMPRPVELGSTFNGTMKSTYRFWNRDEFTNSENLRTVLGWILPPWQRPFVWTEQQQVRFMESVWRGIPVGTYTINMRFGSRFDGMLIDGQQRMRAIERYLQDEFPVFGFRWSEVTAADRRVFDFSTAFPYYETRSDDENYLRGYYDLMNFGGTPHDESQRATPTPPPSS